MAPQITSIPFPTPSLISLASNATTHHHIHVLIKTGTPTLLSIFIYFNLIINTILLPILVGTFLISKTAKRHPTLVNLCVTWIFSGIFACLLFYAGQEKGPEPPQGLCVVQSSVLYGITPMWSIAVLMLLYYVLLCVRGKQGNVGFQKLVFMLASPYIVLVAFTIAALAVSVPNIDLVSRARRFFYCSVDIPQLSLAMIAFTLIICIFILAIEVYLAVITYRNYRALRRAGRHGRIDLEILARVLTFGVYITFGMVVNLVALINPRSVLPDIYAATAGTAVFLVFGTQSDVLRIWFPFLPFSKPPPRPILITLPSQHILTCSDKHPHNHESCNDFDLLGGASPEKVAEAHKKLPPPAAPPTSRGWHYGAQRWHGQSMRSPLGPGMGMDMGVDMSDEDGNGRLDPLRRMW